LHFHIKLVNAFISVFFGRVGGALACFNFFFKEGKKNFEILSGFGQTHSLASFSYADFCFARHSQTSLPLLSPNAKIGLSLGLSGLTMCVAAALAIHFLQLFLFLLPLNHIACKPSCQFDFLMLKYSLEDWLF
jgi:hypothetical protein